MPEIRCEIGGQDFRIVGQVEIGAGPHVRQHERWAAHSDVARRPGAHRPPDRREAALRSVSCFAFPLQAFRIEEVRADLKRVFPDALINDFRQTEPGHRTGP